MTIRTLTPEQNQRLRDVEFYNELYGGRIYNYDAVSGAQISVMVGDNVIIDDATAIQFSLSQSKKPIYGYHSKYFDTIAEGIVIVQGRLFINFIHPGYLRLLLEVANNPKLLDQLKDDNTRAAAYARAGVANYDSTPLSQEALINFVRTESLRNREQEVDLSSGIRRPDLFNSVKLTIQYGSPQFFKNVPVKILEHVHFIGEGQEIQISGQPIQEVYEFICRKVN
jgi:hypothetical protein